MPKAIKPIRVAILGLGRAGWDIHVAAVRDDSRFKIMAVSDPLEKHCAQAEGELGCETFRDPHALLESAKADLVVNATPSPMHTPLSIDAMKAGFHVLLEKPVARDLQEARRLVRAASTLKRKLFIHHNYRFQPVTRHLKEVKESGIIGEVFEIHVRISHFSRRNDWQTLKRNNGGLLNNHGTHYIDSVMDIMDSPVMNVWSDMKLISDAGDAEDHVRVLLRAKSGCVADFFLSTASAATMPMWTLFGTCGTAVCDGGETKVQRFNPQKVKPQTVLTGAATGRQYGNTDRLPWRKKTLKVSSRDKRTFYDNVYEVLRERKPMVVTPESVLDVLKVMDKAKSPIKNMRPQYGK
jgi:scyllo-inositol 2-dehydrogenase (NADP+)